jgi:drug/metabolite transporter (DMT)-like permease
MYERCPACGLKYEREDGYFLGAMYIGYGLGIGTIAVLAALVWEVTRWPILKSTVGGIILFLPLAPVLTWMARVLWIYLDQSVDPDRG